MGMARNLLKRVIEGRDLDAVIRAEIVDYLKAAASDEAQAFVQAAMRHHHKDGEVEIDGDALVSLGSEDGAYVEAWVFVTNAEVETAADS